MKYKVGDKVLINTEVVRCSGNVMIVKFVGENGEYYDICPNSKSIYTPDMTVEEVWNIVKRLFLNKCDGIDDALSDKEIMEIFGTRDLSEIVNKHTPQQIKVKIESWEGNKINIGDEVASIILPNNDEYKIFVTYINNSDNTISGFSGFTGETFSNINMKKVQKTGRHIDIDKILKQIGDTDA